MATKTVSFDELKQHTTKDDLYILISGKVYNVTKFIDEHPGGDEVILAEAGKDATEAFEDVGHSDEAREFLPPLFVGEIEGGAEAVKEVAKKATEATAAKVNQVAEQGSSLMYFIPLGFLGAYFAWRFYSQT